MNPDLRKDETDLCKKSRKKALKTLSKKKRKTSEKTPDGASGVVLAAAAAACATAAPGGSPPPKIAPRDRETMEHMMQVQIQQYLSSVRATAEGFAEQGAAAPIWPHTKITGKRPENRGKSVNAESAAAPCRTATRSDTRSTSGATVISSTSRTC